MLGIGILHLVLWTDFVDQQHWRSVDGWHLEILASRPDSMFVVLVFYSLTMSPELLLPSMLPCCHAECHVSLIELEDGPSH